MSATHHYQADIPVLDAVDVLVVGGGPAGLAAAVGAARLGVRVRLLERFGSLGGNLTAGLVGPCMTSYSQDGKHRLIAGVFGDFVDRMVAVGGALDPGGIPSGSAWSGFIVTGHERVTPFEPEAAKRVAFDLVRESGVSLLLHSFVVDALVESGEFRAVVVANKAGLAVQPARVVVDCSGDGDVAAFAGVPTVQGRDSDGLTQPATLFFRVANVDDAVVERWVQDHPDEGRLFESIVGPARQAGRYPAPRRGVGLYRTQEPGVWRANTTRILGVDGTDPWQLTRAELEGRDQVHALMEFFRGQLPGFADAKLFDTASTVGIRETRRIVGEYTLTVDDLNSGRDFPDTVALGGYPVDIHSPQGAGIGTDGLVEVANVYRIPYRTLVPTTVDGILVAGRCLSATHEALAAVRVMPIAFAMGHAAGIGAALAVRGGLQPREVAAASVRDELRRQGAILEPPQ